MNVAEIWRYPVKSMAGEQLQHARIGPLGVEGDRVVRVENARGQVVTARSHPRLLGHHAALGSVGGPRVDGRLWSSEDVAAESLPCHSLALPSTLSPRPAIELSPLSADERGSDG